MSANFEIRPRFKKTISLSEEEIVERFQKALKQPNAPVTGTVVDHHIFLKIPAHQQHYWSPQLDLEIEETEEGSLIRGLFGPKPSVWFMFVFFYILLGFISMVVAIMGFSQLNLGLSAKILWLLPISLVLFLFIFFTAKTGQKLGKDEMFLLYDFYENTLK